MHKRTTSFLLSCVLLVASSALAEPDAKTKAKARDIGLQGLSSFDNGDYAGAHRQFEQAYGMYRAPTLGLYSARALAKLGRLVEAAARYQEVVNAPLPKDASAQFRQAKADAETERVALIQRIPRLRVEVAGQSEQPTEVTVDGAGVPANALDAGVALDPGAHVVKGQRGLDRVSMNVALQEGETRTITLEFKPADAPAAAPPPVAPPAQPTAAPAPGQTPPQAPFGPRRDTGAAPSDPGSGRRTIGWVLIGLGGVGIGVGAATGAMASGKKTDLERVCPDLSHCPESARPQVDEYMNLRTASTIGFVAGGVGVVGGILLIATAPKASAPERAARLTPWVGIGSAGMRGVF